MKFQVRYYSRTGNTKALANAIAKGLGVKAISIDLLKTMLSKKGIMVADGYLYFKICHLMKS